MPKPHCKATAFVALGANLDDPIRQLQQALETLRADNSIEVTAISAIYRSAAYGVTDQNDFYNAAIKINTEYSAIALLNRLLDIEKRLGRVRHSHWGPRCIDLDLLAYNDEHWRSSRLTLPHPGIHLRRFVLYPLCDIAPHFELVDKPITQLIDECEPQNIERLTETVLH